MTSLETRIKLLCKANKKQSIQKLISLNKSKTSRIINTLTKYGSKDLLDYVVENNDSEDMVFRMISYLILNKRAKSAASYLNKYKKDIPQEHLNTVLNLYLCENKSLKYVRYLINSIGAKPNEDTVSCLSNLGSPELIEYFDFNETQYKELLSSSIMTGNKELVLWLIKEKKVSTDEKDILDCFPSQSDKDTIHLYGLAVANGLMNIE